MTKKCKSNCDCGCDKKKKCDCDDNCNCGSKNNKKCTCK